MDDIALPGLNDSRRQVIVSGLAITQAVFDGLAIDHMRIANGALREGVLYDLVGRLSHEDIRERTVSALLARYCADQTHAHHRRVLGSAGWPSKSRRCGALPTTP